MKRNITFVLALALLTLDAFAVESDWSEPKNIRVTQSQKNGSALYIWTHGSWFPQGHRCSMKTVVLLTPNATSSDGFEQMFSQVLAAKATGKQVQFGSYGVCSPDPNDPYFYAEFIRVYED